MTKIHVISDLFLGFNEFSDDEECIPDVELVILNGNIGQLKRAMLYVEKLCKKYPKTQFVYNLGELELHITSHIKTLKEIETQLSIRKNTNSTWPKNLHWSLDPMLIPCRNGQTIDIFCLYGYPKVHSLISGTWEETNWSRYYTMDIDNSVNPEGLSYKPVETSNVYHGGVNIMADLAYIRNLNLEEETRARNWELTENNAPKILVTHINPYKDSRLTNQVVSPYLIHMNYKTWISSDTPCEGVMFLGGKLYTNVGRGKLARSKVFTIN